MTKNYQKLTDIFHRIHVLGEVSEIMNWDKEVIMPAGGVGGRAEQLSALAVMSHELITQDGLGDLLDGAATEKLDDWQAANVREMRRQWVNATCLSADLVKALSEQATITETVWRDAKPNNDFKAVKPELEKMLALSREQASALADALDLSSYDALLQLYEPYLTSAEIDVIFDDLAAFLPDFIQAVIDKQAGEGRQDIIGPFPLDDQEVLCHQVLAALKFDFNKGRLDVSSHPFSTGPMDDMRITTRFAEDNFLPSLMATIHECGHANYTAGLPEKYRYQPVGQARGMMLHESQSLITEMQACRSPEFVRWLAPKIREAFGGSGKAWEDDNLLSHYHKVERSFIRVDADEVTYPAHVILRYRLEKAMLSGDLEVADLPGAWNDGFEGLIGLTPPDDRRGCLQDIHWHMGAFGYFPTYTLGAMTAAQLFDAACQQDKKILPGIAKGDFAPFLAWNRKHIHAQASIAPAQDIIKAATGQKLNAEVFKAHLKRRYL